MFPYAPKSLQMVTVAEDEMVGWHHRLNEHEFEQALGDGEEQGSLVCFRSRGHKELNLPE